MMRVTTLYAATAATTASYYTRYLTEAPGELPGQWLGNQADRLGLRGEVSTEALELLLSGCDPMTGEIARPPAGRPHAVERQGDPGGRRVRRDVVGAEVVVGVVGAHRRRRARRVPRRRRAGRRRLSRAVRGDDPYPLQRRTAAPRHPGADDGRVPPDHVPRRRPAAAHPSRDLGQGADRRRALAGARRPVPEAPSADARRPVPVGAARRAHPPLRRRASSRSSTARPRSPASPPSCSPCSRSAPPRSTRRWPSSSPSSAGARAATRPGSSAPRCEREAAADTRAHKTGQRRRRSAGTVASRGGRPSASPPTSLIRVDRSRRPLTTPPSTRSS